MTGFLASVSSVDEAQLVRSLGADVIDLKDPARGALGALDEDSVRAIASLPDRNTMLSATVGDLPAYAAELESAVTGMHGCGVDIVKVGVFDRTISPFMLSVLDRLAGRDISIVLVFFAEMYPPDIDFQAAPARRHHGSHAGYLREGKREPAGQAGRRHTGGVRPQGWTGRIGYRPGGFIDQGGHPTFAGNQPGLPGVPRRLVQTTSAHFRDGRRESCRNQEADSERFSFHKLGGSLG